MRFLKMVFKSGDMIGPQRLDLKWFEFQENAGSTFRNLRGSSDFADVTLVSGDGHQVEAHKVILASSSNFFLNLLERSNHSRPLIYMRGINLVDLTALVDFIYFGETAVQQGNIDTFIALAKELGLKGLESKAKEEGEAVFDNLNAGDSFEGLLDEPSMKPWPGKVSQSFLNRQIGSSDDTGERIQTSKMVDPTEGNGIGEQELEEKANFGEELENQAIASNCHQALSVKDAVDLIQGENFTSVARIPAKPRPGTVWRFHTDRWPRTKNQ